MSHQYESQLRPQSPRALSIGEGTRPTMRNSSLVVGLGLIASASATPIEVAAESEFPNFLQKWGKSYSTDEQALRKSLYEEAKAKVAAHNREYDAGLQSWYMALNEFADYTPEEFQQLRSTHVAPTQFPFAAQEGSLGDNPATMDWRDKGAVTAVKASPHRGAALSERCGGLTRAPHVSHRTKAAAGPAGRSLPRRRSSHTI